MVKLVIWNHSSYLKPVLICRHLASYKGSGEIQALILKTKGILVGL